MSYETQSKYGPVEVTPTAPGSATVSVGYKGPLNPFEVNRVSYEGHIYLECRNSRWVIVGLEVRKVDRFPRQLPTEAASKVLEGWACGFLAEWVGANPDLVKESHLRVYRKHLATLELRQATHRGHIEALDRDIEALKALYGV